MQWNGFASADSHKKTVALHAIRTELTKPSSFVQIRFGLFSAQDEKIYSDALSTL